MKTHKPLLILAAALSISACKTYIQCTGGAENQLEGYVRNPALHVLAVQNFEAISRLGWSNVEFEKAGIPMSYVVSELSSGGTSKNGFASVSVSGATLAGTPGKLLLQATDETTGRVLSQQTFAYQISGSRLVLVAPETVDQWVKAHGLESSHVAIGIPDLSINTQNARQGQSVSVTIGLVYKTVTRSNDTITFQVDHTNCLTCTL